MLSTTIRIDKKTQDVLKKLADSTGHSLQATLALAVEVYRRHWFFKELNRSVLAARRKPGVWQAELDERREWDATLLDDLEPEAREERGKYNLKKRGKSAKRRG